MRTRIYFKNWRLNYSRKDRNFINGVYFVDGLTDTIKDDYGWWLQRPARLPLFFRILGAIEVIIGRADAVFFANQGGLDADIGLKKLPKCGIGMVQYIVTKQIRLEAEKIAKEIHSCNVTAPEEADVDNSPRDMGHENLR
jgi:hypothetical protein